jgi:uncharacterized protein YecE (DUF72 family)
VLADAGPSVERFFAGGVMQLKEKLGPINWQLMPTKKFEPTEFETFLKLLPKEVEGRTVRHVVEVRHHSFRSPDFIALVREHGVAVAIAGESAYPQIADPTAPFVYARIMGTRETAELGYSDAALDLWAARAQAWASGAAVDRRGPRRVHVCNQRPQGAQSGRSHGAAPSPGLSPAGDAAPAITPSCQK